MRRSFVRRGASGGVRRYVREHYLRDDVYCGAPGPPAAGERYAGPAGFATKLSPAAEHFLVVDTNVALSYIDLLEHAVVDDVVVRSHAYHAGACPSTSLPRAAAAQLPREHAGRLRLPLAALLLHCLLMRMLLMRPLRCLARMLRMALRESGGGGSGARRRGRRERVRTGAPFGMAARLCARVLGAEAHAGASRTCMVHATCHVYSLLAPGRVHCARSSGCEPASVVARCALVSNACARCALHPPPAAPEGVRHRARGNQAPERSGIRATARAVRFAAAALLCLQQRAPPRDVRRAGGQGVSPRPREPTRRSLIHAPDALTLTRRGSKKGESANDRNDRAIRAAAKWYATKATPGMAIVLLSDDADNRAKAKAEGLTAVDVREYVLQYKGGSPELLDLVAAGQAANNAETKGSGGGGSGPSGKRQRRERIYTDHLSSSELTRRLAAGTLHQGTLRVSRYNGTEATLAAAGVEGGEIAVSGREALNRSVDGDTVAVELLPRDQWRRVGDSGRLVDDGEGNDVERAAGDGGEQAQAHEGGDGGKDDVRRPTGRVVGIIRRGWRPYCGSLEPLKAGRKANPGQAVSVLFLPAERKVPKVRITTRQYDTLVAKRVVVAIDRWDADSMYPEGHYVRSIGDIGDRSTESDMILLEHDVEWSPFTPAVHACVPKLPWAPSAEDRSAPWRRDCRGDLVCSVDPPGCRDIDDALGCERLPNGNLKVSVHIADVTHFVKAGTPLDLEASRRATSVYLVERRIDMLPKPLTEEICSLRADVERLTFSVQWEMTDDAEVVKVDFFKALIKSRAALSYGEAQARMDDKNANDDLTISLRNLNALAKKLRAKRVEAGALTLASPEVKFEIDRETHDPLDVGMYETKEANHMVEEFMLLANCAVAERTLAHYPSCALLRRHEAPKQDAFAPLLAAVRAVGLDLDTDSSRALADSLDAACAQGPTGAEGDADPYFSKMVRIMATRCMCQAVYLSSGEAASRAEFLHYGLAMPLYTHFTSPIRRYADVMVHRLLSASLGLDPLPAAFHDRAGARELVANLNFRHHAAQLAGRASVELHTHIFFKGKVVTIDARVIKVLRNGVVVFIPKYGLEGAVHLLDETAPAETGEKQQPVVVAEDGMSLVARGGALSLRVFDRVDVTIEVVIGVANRPRLTLTLAQTSG